MLLARMLATTLQVNLEAVLCEEKCVLPPSPHVANSIFGVGTPEGYGADRQL